MWLLYERLLDPMLEGWARERIKYMRGAQAEALVAWLLGDMDDGWEVFNNLQLDDAGDIDHVAVGPGGVWCISTKSMRGLLTIGADGQLQHNLKPVNWLGAAKAQTMRLRERLAALLGADVPYVNAVLAVPFMYVDFRSPCQNVYICHQDDLLPRIDDAPKRLSKQQVERVAGAVAMLAGSAKHLYQRSPAPTAG